MKLVIIGGNGLLGTHAAREAVRRGHGVTILSRGNTPVQKELENDVRSVIGNVCTMSGPI